MIKYMLTKKFIMLCVMSHSSESENFLFPAAANYSPLEGISVSGQMDKDGKFKPAQRIFLNFL